MMSGIKRSTKTRKFGSRNQHKRTEEDNTFSPLEILRGDCDFEKKELEEEYRKDTPEWMIEKIITDLKDVLQANGLPTDPYANYCSEEYAKSPEAYEAKHKNNRFGLLSHTWNLQTQVEKMTKSALCRETAAALLLAVTLLHQIKRAQFDETSTTYALHLALTMPRLKMLEMEREAAAGRSRMDGVRRAIEENIQQKETWNEIAFKKFELLSKGALPKEEIYRKISRELSKEGFHKEPDTIKKAIIKNQRVRK